MALQQTYGVKSCLIPAAMATSLFLSGCSLFPSPEPKTQIVTQIQKTEIPVVARPKPVQLVDTQIFVVNKDNYEEFVKQFTDINGNLAYVALAIKDYENLALNISELKRYIDQQQEIIVYYERAVSPEDAQDSSEVDTSRVLSETSVGNQ